MNTKYKFNQIQEKIANAEEALDRSSNVKKWQQAARELRALEIERSEIWTDMVAGVGVHCTQCGEEFAEDDPGTHEVCDYCRHDLEECMYQLDQCDELY
jgi:hypothetical protein